MVAAGDLRPDVGVFHTGQQTLGHDEVVDTPSGVLLSGVKAVGPPGVDALGIRIKMAERIGEAGG